MRKSLLRTSVFSVVIALSVAAAAQDVHTDHDKSANFGSYHTYSWAKVHTTNPLWEQRIQDVVDKDLQAKGGRECSLMAILR